MSVIQKMALVAMGVVGVAVAMCLILLCPFAFLRLSSQRNERGSNLMVGVYADSALWETPVSQRAAVSVAA